MSRTTRIAATTAATALLCLSPGAVAVAADDGAQTQHELQYRHWGLDPNDFPLGSYYTGEPTTAGEGGAAPVGPLDIGRQRNDVGLLPDLRRVAPGDLGRKRNDIGDYGLSPDRPAVPVDTGTDPGDIVGWTALGVAAGSAIIATLIVVRRRHDASGHLPDAA